MTEITKVRTLGDLEALPLEVFCKFFSGRNNWFELKELIYKLPQIRERLYACVEEIDFADEFPLIGPYYNLFDWAPILTPKLVNNVLQRFLHIKKYYADVESDGITNEVIDLIKDVRAQELVIRLRGKITPDLITALEEGLIKRLKKYGTNFTLVVVSNYETGLLFKYVMGVIRIPTPSLARKQVIDIIRKYPDLFTAGLGNVYNAPIKRILVTSNRFIIDINTLIPKQVSEVVYIGNNPDEDKINYYGGLEYFNIYQNVTLFKYPVNLQEIRGYDLTTDMIIDQFRLVFPQAKKIYPVEYFLIEQQTYDQSDNDYMWETLKEYQAQYGDFIAMPDRD